MVQDWTKQESEDAEGVVTFSYRTERENPPDIQTIQKQMAIVAWQPGPNRVVQVPNQVRSMASCSMHHENPCLFLSTVFPRYKGCTVQCDSMLSSYPLGSCGVRSLWLQVSAP